MYLNKECMQGNGLPMHGNSMVLLLDGNSEFVAHAWRKIGLFSEKSTICECSLSKQKCLKQIK